MYKSFSLILFFTLFVKVLIAQTPLTTAPNFSVKTVDGAVIELYPILDQGKVVVLDFFSVSCGPCQLYAPHFQGAFEAFGRNMGNVFFLGVNYNGTNSDVIFFDSLYGLTFPSASGLDGGGNAAYHLFQVAAYPTVLVIKPDKVISHPYVWPPTTENITEAIVNAGGTLVGLDNKQRLYNFNLNPNPVKDQSVVHFTMLQPGMVALELLDLYGRPVRQLMSARMHDAGEHSIKISSEELPNGIFFVTLNVGKERFFQKIVVLKH